MTLKEKLELPIVRFDMGSGNVNMRQPEDDWIRVDARDDITNIDYVGDFGELPFPNGIADEIWSGDSIEHIHPLEYSRVLGEWNRLLKIGGKFSFSTPNLHSTMTRYAKGELSFKDALGALYGAPDKPFHAHPMTFTAQTLTELLNNHGFGIVDLSESPGHADPHEAWWLRGFAIKNRNL